MSEYHFLSTLALIALVTVSLLKKGVYCSGVLGIAERPQHYLMDEISYALEVLSALGYN